MSTNEYVWSDIRDKLVEETGDTPGQAQEAKIIEAFEKRPALVARAADRVLARYKQGLIRSPWVILAMSADEAVEASKPTAAVVDDREREKAASRAAQWMRSAGMHFDREEEVEDELKRGFKITNPFDLDELLDLWRSVRPTGEAIEQEEIVRAERTKALRPLLRPKADVVSQHGSDEATQEAAGAGHAETPTAPA